VVVRLQGLLQLFEAAFMLLPLGVSWWFGEESGIKAFGWSAAITAGAGLLMTFGLRPRNTAMRKREGIMLTAVVWVVFSLFGMLPFLLSGVMDSVTDAFVEAMAGFTTTGVTMIVDLDNAPKGILLWRSLCQWIGGMGILLFTLAVVPMLNHKGGITLFNAEVTGITHEKLKPRISQTAKNLWLIYLMLTIVLAVLLVLGPMDWFDAVCHALSTTSTGGYSTKAAGLLHWQSWYVYIVITVFMFLGGVNFALIYAMLHGNFRRLKDNLTFRCYCGIIIIGSILIFANMIYSGVLENTQDRIIKSLFETTSAITSTGYSLTNHRAIGQFISLLLLMFMISGGMSGSTSGGAKLDRIIVLLKNTNNEIYRTLHPNAVRSVHNDGKLVAAHSVAKVNAFFVIYAALLLLGALVMTQCNVPVFDAITASASALANSGMGYDLTETGVWWATLPDACKWTLAFEMLIGRLELFTVLVIFTRGFWARD